MITEKDRELLKCCPSYRAICEMRNDFEGIGKVFDDLSSAAEKELSMVKSGHHFSLKDFNNAMITAGWNGRFSESCFELSEKILSSKSAIH